MAPRKNDEVNSFFTVRWERSLFARTRSKTGSDAKHPHNSNARTSCPVNFFLVPRMGSDEKVGHNRESKSYPCRGVAE